jgi:hypothetical protein
MLCSSGFRFLGATYLNVVICYKNCGARIQQEIVDNPVTVEYVAVILLLLVNSENHWMNIIENNGICIIPYMYHVH